MDASKAQALGIIPLDQLYLLAIVGTINADKLDSVLQDFGGDQGRIWMVRKGSTVPEAYLDFAFERDSVKFECTTRSERVISRVVRYGEGIDGFLSELSRHLSAGRIAAPRKVAA